MKIIQTAGKTKKSKYIDVGYHFTKEKQLDKTIAVKYVPTTGMEADILSKPLTPVQYQHNLKLIKVTAD